MVKNLKDLMAKFADESKCREFLAQQRWNGVPECPKCGGTKVYNIQNGKRFKCANNKCYYRFSVTMGTVFEASNIPLSTWFPAMYLIISHKKGISSVQLAKDLGVTQKTAWFMLHRIRESLREKGSSLLSNVVEVDEVYIGGKVGNMSRTKRTSMRTENGGTVNNKIMVIGMLEREGKLRLVVSGKADRSNETIMPIVRKNIDKSSCVITDTSSNYMSLQNEFAVHEMVNHSANEFVRSGIIHTNSIEGAFSLFKRSIIGIYHQLSPKHLSKYCDETAYRYNTRKMNDGQRFEMSLTNLLGRLSYKELIKETELTNECVIAPKLPAQIIMNSGIKREIYQISEGKVMAKYPSLIEAEKITGIKMQGISKVLRGLRSKSGGYEWKYA